MNNTIVRLDNLVKTYNGRDAVNHVSLTVNKGDIYGFLGQNGAGKTTTLRMIMGLLTPTSGEIYMFGERVIPGGYNHYRRIGSVIETAGFYPNLTASENLEIHRRLMGVKDKGNLDEALELTGLFDVSNKRVKDFSLGMKQRLGIARALLHKPEFLILDEPTNGLDPVGIKEIRKLIINLAKTRNITVMLSSHILSEVQQLATRIGIINAGCLLEEIGIDELEQKNRSYVELIINDEKAAASVLENELNIHDYTVVERGVIWVYERFEDTETIGTALFAHGLRIRGISIKKQTLEDYFLKVTGGNFNVS